MLLFDPSWCLFFKSPTSDNQDDITVTSSGPIFLENAPLELKRHQPASVFTVWVIPSVSLLAFVCKICREALEVMTFELTSTGTKILFVISPPPAAIDYVHMGCSNPTTDLILKKVIFGLRCLHELLIECSIHIPGHMSQSIVWLMSHKTHAHPRSYVWNCCRIWPETGSWTTTTQQSNKLLQFQLLSFYYLIFQKLYDICFSQNIYIRMAASVSEWT